jgi:hypothetical protein
MPMDHDPRCCARLDPARPEPAHRHPDPGIPEPRERRPADPGAGSGAGSREGREEVDWLGAQAELDECDGYVVLAIDPQTGEVDAHGPFPGLDALRAAQSMRETLDREELADVVVRVVRWHQHRFAA